MKCIVKTMAFFSLFFAFQSALPDSITDTYTTGDTLTATTMNNIKSAVNDNFSRIQSNANDITTKQDSLSGSVCAAGEVVQSIAIDGTTTCTTDAIGVGDGHSLDASDGSPVDALIVDTIGNVGIGTATPASLLTISGGSPLFESENSVANFRWRFGTDGSNDFIINKTTGTTFSPLTINENGQVFLTRDSAKIIPEPPCTTLTINASLPGTSGCIEGIMIADNQGGAFWIGHDTNSSQYVELTWLGFSQRGRLRTQGGPLILQELSTENVGISTTTPSSKLDVNGTVTASAFVQVSDARIKTDIHNLESALDKVRRLRGVSYRWNPASERGDDDDADTHIGLLAQEVSEVVPEATRLGADGTWGIKYDAIIPLLIEAIKEQQKQIFELQGRLAETQGAE